MALAPILSTCLKGCSTVEISDITGLYSAENTTGWGAPNLERADVIEALLTIKYTNSDGVSSTTIVDVTTEVQTAVTESILLNTYTLVGDGVLDITYSIKAETESYSVTLTKAIFCNVKCCVQKLAVGLAKELCEPCNKGAKTEKFLSAYTLLLGLSSIVICTGQTAYLKLLKQLQKLCGEKCGCGCS